MMQAAGVLLGLVIFFVPYLGASKTLRGRGASDQDTHQDGAITDWSSAEVAPGDTGLNLLFITDCSAHQRWMAFNVFSSANHAGQNDPITWLRAGCKTSRGPHDAKMAEALYSNAKVVDVHTSRWGGDFNLGFGVPKAMQSYLDAHRSLPNTTVLALIEADMIFLRRLRIDDLAEHGIPAEGMKLLQHDNSYISSRTGVVSTYDCCGYLGPPYMFSVQSWREILPFWNDNKKGSIWGADQKAFFVAAKAAGIHANAFEHLMVMRNTATKPGWDLLEEAVHHPGADVCATKRVGLQPGVPNLPTFLHVVQPWSAQHANTSESWGFSKYQVPPGWKRERPHGTDGIMDCRMPSFAEPPANLLQMSSNSKVESWIVCSIIHSLNSMLTSYKQVACPHGYNEAKALKMKVPLTWENQLLDAGLDSAPPGTDLSWLRDCAEQDRC